MAAKWQRIKIKLPKGYKPADRLAIGQEIVDHIVARTLKGKDVKGRPFPKYSKSYKESLDFKNAGKSKGRVSLKLTGDMLANLELLSHRSGEVTVGFERGSEENAKADGNIRGTYGTSSPIPGKDRQFLGVSGDEKRKILKKFPLKDPQKRAEEVAAILASIEEANKLLGK